MAAVSNLLSLASLLFVISSLLLFIFKNLVTGGWTAAETQITPLRWISATVVPVIVVSWGHSKKSLSTSGALCALVVGFCLTLAHYSFFLCLLAFFVSSSKATKYKGDIKRKFEADYKEGGQRNWLQVLCNGGMATELALLYLLDIGSADLPVDFRNQYRASWLGMAVLGAMACCNGDTWASELGTVLGTSDPVLLTTFQKVPKGTNGGVTVIGLACSLVGGLVIGFAYWLGIVMSAASLDLALAPTQLLVILVGGLGGLLGSLLDSLIGASLQFSGRDSKTGQIVEVEREGVVPISGKMILDNHSVNLVSTILTALLVPKVALGLGL
jgi:uncharacterized protein (TIGR00297 family)